MCAGCMKGEFSLTLNVTLAGGGGGLAESLMRCVVWLTVEKCVAALARRVAVVDEEVTQNGRAVDVCDVVTSL